MVILEITMICKKTAARGVYNLLINQPFHKRLAPIAP